MFTKEKKEIKFRAIIEIMGRPPEFLTETLTKTVEAIEKEGKMKLLSKQIFEPKVMEEQEELFNAFAEVEVLTLGLDSIFEFIFLYAPSNIEIIEPSEIGLNANDANAVVNGFIARIHKIDSVNKMLMMENSLLKKRLGSLTPEQIQQLDMQREEIMKKQIEEMQKQEKEKKKEEKSEKPRNKKSKKKK